MKNSFFVGLSCFLIFVSITANSFALWAPVASPWQGNNSVLTVQTSQIPDWCINLIEDKNLIKACGIAESKNLSIARSRATIDAKRQIADQINGAISSVMEEIVTSISSGSSEEVASKVEVITESVVKKTKLSGYEVVQSHLTRTQAGYAYVVLLQYSKALINETIVEEAKSEVSVNDTKDEFSTAIFELEKEIARQRALQ
jgi:hypothetical protein